MATIQARKTRNGKTHYRAQVRLEGYPPQSRTFERKSDAKDWVAETESGLKAGRLAPLGAVQKHKLGELVDRYIQEVLPSKPAVAAMYERHLAWWKGELGVCYLADLTSDVIESAYGKLLQEPGPTKRMRTPATANRYLISLSSCISYGRKKLKWISTNPVSGVEKKKEPKGRVRFLSRPADEKNSELERLLTACRESRNRDLLDLVTLGIWTGCRAGELMALRRSYVRLAEGGLTLPAQVTKTKRDRFVPLTGPALEVVQRRMTNVREDTDYLFASSRQRDIELPPAFPRAAWNQALTRACLENFRFHDLRHTHASYLAMSGATERELMEALGHSTTAMASRYAHLANEHKRFVVRRLEAAMDGWS